MKCLFFAGDNCEHCVDGFWGHPVIGGNCTGTTATFSSLISFARFFQQNICMFFSDSCVELKCRHVVTTDGWTRSNETLCAIGFLTMPVLVIAQQQCSGLSILAICIKKTDDVVIHVVLLICCQSECFDNYMWLGGVVVRALDLRLEITCSIPAAALLSATLDKLFTHIV